jgi:hypothetical protein
LRSRWRKILFVSLFFRKQFRRDFSSEVVDAEFYFSLFFQKTISPRLFLRSRWRKILFVSLFFRKQFRRDFSAKSLTQNLTFPSFSRKQFRRDFSGGVVGAEFYLRNCGFFCGDGALDSSHRRSSSGNQPDIDIDFAELQ